MQIIDGQVLLTKPAVATVRESAEAVSVRCSWSGRAPARHLHRAQCALNPDQDSTRGKIKRAGWDDAFLLHILSAA